MIDEALRKRIFEAAEKETGDEPPDFGDIPPDEDELHARGGTASATAAWTLPEPISAEEMHAARAAPRCIVEGYLWADVGTLVAPGGSSKTTMTLHEAVRIVLGRPVWGQRVVTPGPVLLVTAEDQRERLVARVREICKAMALTPGEVAQVRENVRIADFTAQLRRLTEIERDVVVVSDLAGEIVQGCNAAGFHPALVQFDPLVSFGVGESRVNDAEQGLVNAARVIVAGLDCAVRLVHHTGQQKALEKAAHQYAGRGGTALSDGARMVHVINVLDDDEFTRHTGHPLADGETALRLSCPKLSYAPRGDAPIFIVRQGYDFRRVHAAPAQTKEERMAAMGEQMARFILADSRAGRRHTRHTLETQGPENMTRADVRAALDWLQAQGRIERVPIVNKGGKTPKTGARDYLRVVGEPTHDEEPE